MTYEPFGQDWINHALKLPKRELVDMLREALIEKIKLEAQLLPFADTSASAPDEDVKRGIDEGTAV